MATLGQYTKAQSKTAAASDATLQALMMLMQYMQQREDRELGRQESELQLEGLRLMNQMRERELLEGGLGRADFRTIQQVESSTAYGRLESYKREMDTLLANPGMAYQHLDGQGADDFADSTVAGLAQRTSGKGLGTGTGNDIDRNRDWTKAWDEGLRRYEALESVLENSDIPADEVASFLERTRAELVEVLQGPPGTFDFVSSQEGAYRALVMRELASGAIASEDITEDYIRGKYGGDPFWGEAIPWGEKSAVYPSYAPKAVLEATQILAGGTVEDFVARNPEFFDDFGNLEELTPEERLGFLQSARERDLNKAGGFLPEREPSMLETVGGAVADAPVTTGLGALAAAKLAATNPLVRAAGKGLFDLAKATPGAAWRAAPALLAGDLAARGIGHGLGYLDPEGQTLAGAVAPHLQEGLLAPFSAAGELYDEVLTAPGEMGLPEEMTARLAEYAGSDNANRRRIYDQWLRLQRSLAGDLTSQIREAYDRGDARSAQGLQDTLDKVHAEIQEVLNIRTEKLREEEDTEGLAEVEQIQKSIEVGPPAPPTELGTDATEMMLPPPGDQARLPLELEADLPAPEQLAELAGYDPLAGFLGQSQGPAFALDSPFPSPYQLPLGTTGQDITDMQQLALQSGPTAEMMLGMSPPPPGGVPPMPPPTGMPAPYQTPAGTPEVTPETLLQVLAGEALAPLSGLGSPPVPPGVPGAYTPMEPNVIPVPVPVQAPSLTPEMLLQLIMGQGVAPLSGLGSPPIPSYLQGL